MIQLIVPFEKFLWTPSLQIVNFWWILQEFSDDPWEAFRAADMDNAGFNSNRQGSPTVKKYERRIFKFQSVWLFRFGAPPWQIIKLYSHCYRSVGKGNFNRLHERFVFFCHSARNRYKCFVTIHASLYQNGQPYLSQNSLLPTTISGT